MKKPNQIEEEHIKELAYALNLLGIEVDVSYENHYYACRLILETAVSYAHQAQINETVKNYIGLSDTTEKETSE